LAQLFDTRVFSVLVSGAISPGAKLYWYVSGTTTATDTYTTEALDPGAKNTNPVLADANGRFPPIWLGEGEYKYILTSPTGSPASPIISQDPYVVAADPPVIDEGLTDFLAGDEPLGISGGGTGEITAEDALAALGGLPLEGGEVTGAITRDGAPHVFFASGGTAAGSLFVTVDSDPDPTDKAWQIWAKYA
jgi:hypothetical protein